MSGLGALSRVNSPSAATQGLSEIVSGVDRHVRCRSRIHDAAKTGVQVWLG